MNEMTVEQWAARYRGKAGEFAAYLISYVADQLSQGPEWFQAKMRHNVQTGFENAEALDAAAMRQGKSSRFLAEFMESIFETWDDFWAALKEFSVMPADGKALGPFLNAVERGESGEIEFLLYSIRERMRDGYQPSGVLETYARPILEELTKQISRGEFQMMEQLVAAKKEVAGRMKSKGSPAPIPRWIERGWFALALWRKDEPKKLRQRLWDAWDLQFEEGFNPPPWNDAKVEEAFKWVRRKIRKAQKGIVWEKK